MILFRYIWRVYGVIAILAIILVIYPFLIISILSKKTFKFFYFLCRVWGKLSCFFLGWFLLVKKEEKIDYKKNYIIVSNHTSFLDVFSIFAIIKTPTIFIGKKELAKIPVFSTFYKNTNILVDRSSLKSAKKSYERSKEELKKGKNICIFPEGGIPKNPKIILNTFKTGAFKLAKEMNKPILPITFMDNKRLFPYSWKKGGIGIARSFIDKPIYPENYTIEELKEKVYNIIYNNLNNEKI